MLWRWSGGLFEDPAEDDIVGLALLGASLALGALLCVQGRSGRPALSWLLCGMGAYCVAAWISIAAGRRAGRAAAEIFIFVSFP